jgi:lipoprotein-anchoring transpeptidase ErfK/SrfK
MCIARLAAALAATMGLAACVDDYIADQPSPVPYVARLDGGHAIPAIPPERFPAGWQRARVRFETTEASGTIVIDTGARFLYLVQEKGTALRYGIAVGREGFGWTGTAHVDRKAHWPRWHPPGEMVARQPHLARWANGGQPPGPENPLGARAIYLADDTGRNTGYRIHGTPEWWTIGSAASSGCIRMVNQDVIDLFDRVPIGAKVIVR